jgi:hypothetical protein
MIPKGREVSGRQRCARALCETNPSELVAQTGRHYRISEGPPAVNASSTAEVANTLLAVIADAGLSAGLEKAGKK